MSKRERKRKREIEREKTERGREIDDHASREREINEVNTILRERRVKKWKECIFTE